MVKKESSKTSKKQLILQFFKKKQTTRRKINHKGTLLSLEDQQTRNSFFREKRDCTKGTIKKTFFFVKKGEKVKGEIF